MTDSYSVRIKKSAEKELRGLPKRMIGQRVYVHASLRYDPHWDDKLAHHLHSLVHANAGEQGTSLGAIVGEVTLIGCGTHSQSAWFTGPYGWFLADPVAYDKPISYKGRLKFFHVDLRGKAHESSNRS